MPARCARPLFSSFLVAACLSGVSLAQAQPGPLATTWSQEALQGIAESLESPELRALRMYEEELFGKGPTDAPSAFDPDCVYGTPEAFSSDVPPPKVERGGAVVDLSFLNEVQLPSIPVRWDSRVIEYLLFFKNDRRGRELMAAWLRRMERYGPMIRRVLAEHSLPRDLEIVAMIESGYDPVARSNVNAQGLWQFVKVSGEYYGLRIDHWVDERLDPIASTRAASRFLKDLYDRFESWELAFAAYNMGYTGLARAIRKYNTNDYWTLSHLEAGLPYETSLYVAKITAAAIVANNPEKFGFGDLDHEATIEVTSVSVPAGTSLSPIASAAGVSVDSLKALNAHLKKGRVAPGELPVNVYIPRENYVRFAERWSKSKEPTQITSYTVRFGETLEDVARRFNISSAKLRTMNELSSDARVNAGFALFVPAVAEVNTASLDKPIATVPDRVFQYENRRRVFYRVAGNDTLPSVARFFEVTVDELRDWNNLGASAALQKGMLLQMFVRPELDLGRAVVLTSDDVRILTVGSEEFFDYHEAQRDRVRVRYRVQQGDTMAKLAEKFELSAGSIGRINQFASNKELKVDDWIIVYVPEKQVPELERKGVIARISPVRAEALADDPPAPATVAAGEADRTEEEAPSAPSVAETTAKSEDKADADEPGAEDVPPPADDAGSDGANDKPQETPDQSAKEAPSEAPAP